MKKSFSALANFHPKQWAATEIADKTKYFLFGGSRGPGKSYWLRWYLLRCLLIYAGRGFRDVCVCLATEDYPSLVDRQVRWIEDEFPEFLGKLGKRQDRGFGFHLRSAYGGGSILLRNLDKRSKVGAGYAVGAIDELGLISKESFDFFRSSIRWPGIDDCRFLAATNPVPGWVRSYWIEGRFPPEFEKFADHFTFLSALPGDNPSLDSNYWEMLETLPDGLRESWLHGDWYAAVQGLVYGDFSQDNISPNGYWDGQVLADVPIEVAIDDGYVDPRAILFIQRTGRDIRVVDEIYESSRLEDESISELKEKLEQADHFEAWRKKNSGRLLPELVVCSHEAVQLRAQLRRADIVARDWFSNRDIVNKKSKDRKPRAAAIKMTRRLVRDGKGVRSIFVHRRCRNLIDELSMGYKLKRDVRGEYTEVPADGNDHAAQALEGYVYARCKSMARG